MKVPIEKIVIPPRARKEVGSLHALVRSIEKHGLLHPLVVDQNINLISGFRRLHALKQLGYRSAEVTMLEIEKKSEALEIEIEENIRRKDFTDSETAAAYKMLELLVRRELPWWKRLLNFLLSLFRRKKQ